MSLQRLALLPLLMVIYSFVIFAIIQAPPGDFLTAYVATLASSGSSIVGRADRRRCAAQYGLDQPFIVQYFLWMQHLVHGDFGLSLEYQRPNADLIGEQLGLTLALALVLLRADLGDRDPGRHLFGDPSALDGRPRADGHQLCRRRHAQLHAGADPDVGRLRLFRHQRHRPLSRPSSSTRRGASREFVDLLGHIWLPALVLGIAGTARLSRIMRANLLDELNKPYVVTARAKGMKEWRLVLRYPVRLAFNPLVSTIGWYLPRCSPAA